MSLSPHPRKPVHSLPWPYPLTSQPFVPCALCTMVGAPRAPNSCCIQDAGLLGGRDPEPGPSSSERLSQADYSTQHTQAHPTQSLQENLSTHSQ